MLALDPGETTGWCVVDARPEETIVRDQGQWTTWPIESAVKAIGDLLIIHRPTYMVYEAYHVYSWRLEQHSFSEVPTIQIIGCLRTLAVIDGIPCDCQTAQTGKAFFTDQRLEQLGLYNEGMRHARDALRHACQFLTFGIKSNVG